MILPFLILGVPILLQVVCIIHIIKTERERTWIYIVIFVPVIGSVAYFIVEIIPSLLSGKKPRELKNALAQSVFGSRKIAELERLLSLSDTYQNRHALADEYLSAKMYDKAIDMYLSCLNGIYADDPHLLQTIANTYSLKHDHSNARIYFEKAARNQSLEKKYLNAYAFALAALDEHEKAEAIYTELDKGFNIEGIYGYAVLLEKLNRIDEAREKYKHVQFISTTLPRYVYREDKKWINLSRDALNRLLP